MAWVPLDMLAALSLLQSSVEAPICAVAAAQLIAPAALGSSPVELILVLFFGHLLCDFPLQSDKITQGKCPGSNVAGVPWGYWMSGHCGTHALAVSLITGMAWLGAAEFAAHFLIDLLKCRKVYNLATDQGLHLACKVIWGLSAVALS